MMNHSKSLISLMVLILVVLHNAQGQFLVTFYTGSVAMQPGSQLDIKITYYVGEANRSRDQGFATLDTNNKFNINGVDTLRVYPNGGSKFFHTIDINFTPKNNGQWLLTKVKVEYDSTSHEFQCDCTLSATSSSRRLTKTLDGAWTTTDDHLECKRKNPLCSCPAGEIDISINPPIRGCRGTQDKVRYCTNPAPQNGGQPCVTDKGDIASVDIKENDKDCDIYCTVVGQWAAWGSCDNCQGDQRYRKRACELPTPDPLATPICPTGNDKDFTECSGLPCPIVINGGWSLWSAWSACTKDESGVCSRLRTRVCNNPTPTPGGAYCSGNNARERNLCSTCGDTTGTVSPTSSSTSSSTGTSTSSGGGTGSQSGAAGSTSGSTGSTTQTSGGTGTTTQTSGGTGTTTQTSGATGTATGSTTKTSGATGTTTKTSGGTETTTQTSGNSGTTTKTSGASGTTTKTNDGTGTTTQTGGASVTTSQTNVGSGTTTQTNGNTGTTAKSTGTINPTATTGTSTQSTSTSGQTSTETGRGTTSETQTSASSTSALQSSGWTGSTRPSTGTTSTANTGGSGGTNGGLPQTQTGSISPTSSTTAPTAFVCANANDYYCQTGSACVSRYQLCDNNLDCPNGNDEKGCSGTGKEEDMLYNIVLPILITLIVLVVIIIIIVVVACLLRRRNLMRAQVKPAPNKLDKPPSETPSSRSSLSSGPMNGSPRTPLIPPASAESALPPQRTTNTPRKDFAPYIIQLPNGEVYRPT